MPHAEAGTKSIEIDAALMGMGIGNVSVEDGIIRVLSPGCAVTLDREGLLHIHQRIGADRELLSLRLDAHHAPWRVAAHTPFKCRLEGSGLAITVQGDSILIFECNQNLRLVFKGHFSPSYDRCVRGNRLLLDNLGGCGIFGIPPRETELDKGGDPWRLHCHLARWDELWVSVCPPRPEDPHRMNQSVSHDILYYILKEGEITERYPSREALEEIAMHCQILALHEEIWRDAPSWVDDPPGGAYDHPKSWETDRHLPMDEAQFVRMREDAHRLGLKVVPYCSPYYCNAPDLFAEFERVLNEYQMDGLYFDGWCPMRDDFRVGYHMLRKARALLGDKILYLHSSSDPFNSVDLYPPFAFAYADFCLRGESGRGETDLDGFLRYTVSGHQISNSVGMWCHYGSMGESGYHFIVPSSEHIQAALRNHVRLWRQSRMWKKYPEELARFDREYYGALDHNSRAG